MNPALHAYVHTVSDVVVHAVAVTVAFAGAGAHVLHVLQDVDAYPFVYVTPAEHAVHGAYCVDEEYPGLHTHAGSSCVKLPETDVY